MYENNDKDSPLKGWFYVLSPSYFLIHAVIVLVLYLSVVFNKRSCQTSIHQAEVAISEVCLLNATCLTDPSMCIHGVCNPYGFCVCDDCYSGDTCNETCTPDAVGSVCCGEHGDSHYGVCKCDDEWYGSTCEHQCSCPTNATTYCETQDDCVHGTCFWGYCACEIEYIGIALGEPCEYERDDLTFCYFDVQCATFSGHIGEEGICRANECYYKE